MSTNLSRSLRQAAQSEGAVVVLPKNPLVSKTIIVNTIMAVATIAMTLMNLELVKENAAWLLPTLVTIHTIANYILRIFTNGPLTISPDMPNRIEDEEDGRETRNWPKTILVYCLILATAGNTVLLAQEPAAKPAVKKLEPAERATTAEAPRDREPARSDRAEEPEAPRRTGSGLFGSFRERREKRLERGLTLANFVKIGKELEAQGEIVKGETPAEEVAAAIVVELQQQNPNQLEAFDWDKIFDLIERLLPLILQLMGW